MSDIAYTQNNIDAGELKIHVTARGSNRPIPDARVSISYSGDPTVSLRGEYRCIRYVRNKLRLYASA